MPTITQKGFIHAAVDDYTKLLEYKFATYQDMTCIGWVFVCEHELTFEVPGELNPIAIETQALKRKKAELTLEFKRRVTPINSRLQDLKCIESSAT